AVRGLIRSLHGDFGFEPQNALLVETDLSMAGYRKDQVPEMQMRILETVQSIPGVTSAAWVAYPPLAMGTNVSPVFTEEDIDLKPANAAATVWLYQISPDYFRAAGTVLLSGRSFTPHDDKDALPVAVVNKEFARRIFKAREAIGDALGRHFKLLDGTRIEVVGIVEDGKYFNIAEAPRPAMFLPIPQSPTDVGFWLVVRSDRDLQQLA